MNGLTKLYKDILASADCKVDENGTVRLANDDPVIVKVDGKSRTLTVPYQSVLKDGNWDKIVAFHPACESIFAGQSEVINMLAYLLGVKIKDNIQIAMASIISLALNTEAKGRLRNKQLELLATFDGINHIVEKIGIDITKRNTGVIGKYPLVSFRLERGGEINGDIYSRTCSLIPHVLNNGNTLCGVTPSSAKGVAVIRTIYEYIIPDTLTYGSNSKDTPYLFALLECFYHTAVHLNNIKSILGKYTVMHSIPVAWHDELKELPKLGKKYIPQPLPGNTGRVISENGKPVAEEVVVDNQPITNLESNKVQITDNPAEGRILEGVEYTKSGLVKVTKTPPPPAPTTFIPQFQQLPIPINNFAPPALTIPLNRPVSTEQAINSYLSQNQQQQYSNGYQQPARTFQSTQNNFQQPMNTSFVPLSGNSRYFTQYR